MDALLGHVVEAGVAAGDDERDRGQRDLAVRRGRRPRRGPRRGAPATSGFPWTSAIAFAACSPTSSEPTSPGPCVTAIAARSSKRVPASASAALDHRHDRLDVVARRRARARRRRRRACSSAWLATTFERMRRPSSTTAAAVSSQEVSIPSTRAAGEPSRRLLLLRGAGEAVERAARAQVQPPVGERGRRRHLFGEVGDRERLLLGPRPEHARDPALAHEVDLAVAGDRRGDSSGRRPRAGGPASHLAASRASSVVRMPPSLIM